ncbi:MAG: twin-arginine translocase TatA/TatE family subunit [Bacteriovoracaceae bacterium]
MFGLGIGEVLLIFVFAIIFIGPKKLPDLAKSLGKGIRDFQRAKNDLLDDINNEGQTTHSTDLPTGVEAPAQYIGDDKMTHHDDHEDYEIHDETNNKTDENKESSS